MKDLHSFLNDQEALIKSIESSGGGLMDVDYILRYNIMAGGLSGIINIHNQYSTYLGGGSKQISLANTIRKHRDNLPSQNIEE